MSPGRCSPRPDFGRDRLDRTGVVELEVALDRPVALVKVTGYEDVVARRLVEALGVTDIRTVYTGMRQAGLAPAPGRSSAPCPRSSPRWTQGVASHC